MICVESSGDGAPPPPIPRIDPRSTGWWPSIDLETTRRLTRGSNPRG